MGEILTIAELPLLPSERTGPSSELPREIKADSEVLADKTYADKAAQNFDDRPLAELGRISRPAKPECGSVISIKPLLIGSRPRKPSITPPNKWC